MGISIPQLLIILLIVALLFGTKKLRGIGSDLGSAPALHRASETASTPATAAQLVHLVVSAGTAPRGARQVEPGGAGAQVLAAMVARLRAASGHDRGDRALSPGVGERSFCVLPKSVSEPARQGGKFWRD